MDRGNDKNQETTHFGFTTVPISEKVDKVAQVFHSVAGRYDFMNDIMSLGTHRIMKQMAVNATRARTGHWILDLAGGTGDLVVEFSPIVGDSGKVCLCDINGSMLNAGRDKLINRGIINNVIYTQADGEQLPFADASFNAVSIAFGLRNITRKERALGEILRVLKPGGKLVVLEFSKPSHPVLKKAYAGFSSIWPKIGKAITGDHESYQYLIESIEVHPDQEELARMIEQAGFERVRYSNILNGIAAIHEGIKARK